MRIALGLVLLLAPAPPPQQKPGAAPRSVLGYYPSWVAHPNLREIRFDRFTHLAHAFLKSDRDGNLIEDKAIPSPELTRRAHETGVKVLLSLGGAGSAKAFRAVVASPEALRRYVAGVAKAVGDAGYDGVDVDWEPTEREEDRKGLIALTGALREQLPWNTMTAAAPGSDWYGRWWDVGALTRNVDFLNVMSYDFHGPWSEHAGHNAALHAAPDDEDGAVANASAALTYWADTRKWPRERLQMGIPCYGRGFAVKSWHQKAAGKATHESIDAHDVRGLIEDGWRRAWDAKVGVPTLLKEGVAELISYEDAESAALKGAWAREKGLRGIFFWNIEQDWADGDHEIVKSAAAAFLGR
ncbi:MAG TPA: glycosyl hydrolase family 18 protein [Planctomycetota bacterium]|nr:glycosyl hydrolase family 18 protein [Planctomycetota bacterium]